MELLLCEPYAASPIKLPRRKWEGEWAVLDGYENYRGFS